MFPLTGRVGGTAGAADSLMAGHDIRTIQELLGHRDVKTTVVSTPVIGKAGGRRVTSPADTIHRPEVLVRAFEHPTCQAAPGAREQTEAVRH